MEIDKVKVNTVTKKILDAEKINLKTKKYNRAQMTDRIKKIIEEEVRKCF